LIIEKVNLRKQRERLLALALEKMLNISQDVFSAYVDNQALFNACNGVYRQKYIFNKVINNMALYNYRMQYTP
jgi:hypothetical protein